MVFYLGPNQYEVGGSHPHVTPLGDNYLLVQRFHEDDGFDAHVAVLAVGTDGSLTEVVSQFDPFTDPAGRGTPPRQLAIVQTSKYHAAGVFHKYTDDPSNGITGYRFNPDAGTLTQVIASSPYPDVLFETDEEPTMFNWCQYEPSLGHGVISRGRRFINNRTPGEPDYSTNKGWRGIVVRYRAGDSEPTIVKTSQLEDQRTPGFSDSFVPLIRKVGGGWWVPMVTDDISEFRYYELDSSLDPTGDHIASNITESVPGGNVDARFDGLYYDTIFESPTMRRAALDGGVQTLTGFIAPEDALDLITPFPTLGGNLWYYINNKTSFSEDTGSLYDYDGNVLIDARGFNSPNDEDSTYLYRDSMGHQPIEVGGKWWYAYQPEVYYSGSPENQFIHMIGEDPIRFDFGTGPTTRRMTFGRS